MLINLSLLLRVDKLNGEPREEGRKGNKETFKPQIAGQKFPCFSVMVILIGIFQQDKDVTAFFSH